MAAVCIGWVALIILVGAACLWDSRFTKGSGRLLHRNGAETDT